MWVICEDGNAVNMDQATHLDVIERDGRHYVSIGLMNDTYNVLKCNSENEAQDAIYDLLIMHANGSKFINMCEPLAERQLISDDEE